MALTDALQNKLRTIFADSLKKEFDPISDSNYFAFFGKCTAWSDDNTPPLVVDSVAEHNSALRNSLFAIRLDSTNTMFVVPRHNWSSGTIYTQYSDSIDLNTPTGNVKYYALVDETFVYKCISNNKGTASTAKPTYTGTNIFSTSDGYKWKFLYKLTEDQKDFLTKEYLPVTLAQKTDDEAGQLQYEVQKNAIDGGITDIKLSTTAGEYLKASPSEHRLTDSVGSTSDTFILDASATTPFTNNADYYNDHVIYISSGFGPEVGRVRRIIDQSEGDITGVSNKLTLESPFGVPLYGTDQSDKAITGFKILPEILVQGDGISAEAVMTVDGTYTPNDIQILNSGKNYTFAYVTFPTTSGLSGDAPTVDIPIAPKGGHGSNPIQEFDISSLMLRFLNENIEGESRLINVNDFRQFGIIKDPILNDRSNRIAGSEIERRTTYKVKRPIGLDQTYAGSFTVGDKLYGFDTKSVSDIHAFFPDEDGLSGRLVVNNLSKNYKLPNTDEDSVRVSFGLDTSSGGSGDGVSGSFINNEIVTQYNSVLGLTAQGVVKGWDSSRRELTIRLTATGDGGAVPFSASTGSAIINDSGEHVGGSGGNYLNIEEEGGEAVGTFNLAAGTFSKMVFEGTTSDTLIGRIVEGDNAYVSGITSSPKPIYKMTTALAISQVGGGPSITDSSFALDEGITQETGRRFTSANVASWSLTGTTGSLVLTDVRGGFTSGGTLEGVNGSFNVDTITDPELVKGSGEVLYIQNVRPIARQEGQREELRIRIGF